MIGKGYKVFTADGVVGTSGTPVVVYSVNLVSDSPASVLKLYDGTSAAGTLVAQFTGTVSAGADFNLGINGVTFKNGCFVDVDANIVTATVFYSGVQ